MNKLPQADLLLAQRYADGELRGEDLARCEQRLLRETALRSCVDELRALRGCFTPGRAEDPAPAPRAGPKFAAAVLAQVRRLPSRAELLAEPRERGEVEQVELQVARVGRRLIAAAALIFTLALLIVSGVLRPVGGRAVEASKNEVQKLIEQIQARDGADALAPRGR
jgi:hypothetical protein